MAYDGDIFHDFEYGIAKINFFLKDVLCKEHLSDEAEIQRTECVTQLQCMSNTLYMLKNYPTYENTLNSGLSQSSHALYKGDLELNEVEIPRSGSLPDMTTNGENKKNKTLLQDSDFTLSEMRELVIYDPIEEEEEDGDDDEEEGDVDPLSLSTSSRSSVKRSRKRDSAVLFDIALGDLEDFDLAGFLTEKHSGKDWYCVLMDQHLCLFHSQDVLELAYDVVILPCCQISLDDRLMRTPVFRLTQPGMPPWVLIAKDNEELKEWINALTTAASGGKYSLTSSSSGVSDRRPAKVSSGASNMLAISEEDNGEVIEEEEVEEEEKDEESTSNDVHHEVENKEEPVKQVNKRLTIEIKQEEASMQAQEPIPEIPTSPEAFGEEIYEPVSSQQDDFEDDGFATDEFDSGSSDNEDSVGGSPKDSPKLQPKTKKKNQLLKWLKKKTKSKGRLFSSPQDGVALAGYVLRLENNECLKRWCVIREGKIYCYKNIKDEDTELTLDLEGTEIRAKEEQKNRFVVRVLKDNERLLTLLTKTSRDMDKWKTALRIESGFIKLTSPVDTTSAGFDDEDEGDYVTPLTPVGLQKVSKNPLTPTTPTIETDNRAKKDSIPNGECDYLEIKEVTGNDEELLGPLPSIPKFPDQDSLGSLPSFPNGRKSPDPESFGPLPNIPNGRKSPDPESLGPLPPLPTDDKPPALPPPRRSPATAQMVEDKEDEEEEDIYEEVKIMPLADADKLAHWHKMSIEERREYEEENKDVPSPELKLDLTPDRKAPFRQPPPLVRKVSFDEKVEVINTSPAKQLQPKPDLPNGDKSSEQITQGSQLTAKPQAEVSPMKQFSAKDMRSLPRRTLKESWIKKSFEEDAEPKKAPTPKGPKIEQDKERELLQKTEDEFLEMAKELREKGSTALRQKRPSVVERNRLAFENRKREEAMAQAKIIPRSEALNKEKADLTSMLEFQKKRVAVAKDRKIFFSFANTTSNTAVADAEMEFHESQFGLAKAKKRIAEIDNELKNIELLELKYKKNDVGKKDDTSKHDDGNNKELVKKKEFRLITDDDEQVKATDEDDGGDETVRNLKKGNVMSKLKVFENMSNK